MANLVCPHWQAAAIEAAALGYPWCVWGSRDGAPLALHASCPTRRRAEAFAAQQRETLRPRGWSILVCWEGQGTPRDCYPIEAAPSGSAADRQLRPWMYEGKGVQRGA